jgi:hypothetical protein
VQEQEHERARAEKEKEKENENEGASRVSTNLAQDPLLESGAGPLRRPSA